jgi:hypothetical protein
MVRMRRSIAAIAALVATVLVACGSEDGGTTPVACLSPAPRYLAALQDAPGEVRVGGETAISDCFAGTQSAGDQAQVGQTVIDAATSLNADARRHPGGHENVMLGYLVGAVHEGAAHSSGINADLVRRLDAAARFNPGGGSPGAAFERAFGKGYAAGEDTG